VKKIVETIYKYVRIRKIAQNTTMKYRGMYEIEFKESIIFVTEEVGINFCIRVADKILILGDRRNIDGKAICHM
jgi:hypothetical protein